LVKKWAEVWLLLDFKLHRHISCKKVLGHAPQHIQPLSDIYVPSSMAQLIMRTLWVCQYGIQSDGWCRQSASSVHHLSMHVTLLISTLCFNLKSLTIYICMYLCVLFMYEMLFDIALYTFRNVIHYFVMILWLW
jgi:hypothetical protein